MSAITQYVVAHTTLVPASQMGPDGVDLVFMKVRVLGVPSADELKRLVDSHHGDFAALSLFDGKEHNYMDVGAWVGSQEIGLRLMALGSKLKLWKLLTPFTVMGADVGPEMATKLAESGLITLLAPK